MKRYIKSNSVTEYSVDNFPQNIEVFDDEWIPYEKLYTYISNNGELCCYYLSRTSSIVTAYISLYPDGHLVYIWNGREIPYNKDWKEV